MISVAFKAAHGARLLLASNGFDAVGRNSLTYGLEYIFVVGLGATAWQIGVLNALESAAFLLLGVPVGIVVDRVGALRALRVGLMLRIFLVGLALGLLLSEAASIESMMVVMALLGVATLLAETSQVAVVPVVIPDRDRSSITNFVARMTSADQGASVIVPGAVGLLLAVAPSEWAVAMAGAFAVAALAIMFRVRAGTKPAAAKPQSSEPPGFWTESLAGMRFLVRRRDLMAITVLAATSNVGLAVGSAVDSILILNHLALGSLWFGAIGTAGAAGGLLGSVIAARISRRFSVANVYLVGASAQVFLSAVVFGTYFLAPGVAGIVLVVKTALWGVAVVSFNVAGAAWAASITPAEIIGRVSSARRLFTMGPIPFAGLLGGIAGTAWGIWFPLAMWPIITLMGLIFFAVRRRHPDVKPILGDGASEKSRASAID